MSAARRPTPAGLLPDDLPIERVRFADVATEIHAYGNGEDPDDQVLVLPAGTHLPGSLWLDYREGSLSVGDDDHPVVGILVRGDLRIDGCLVNWEDDYGPFLEVHGDLTANAIATGGSQIHVGGDVVTGELVGVYNHGSVVADGDLTARVIASEHTVEAKGRTNGLYHPGWHSTIHAVRDGVPDEDDPYLARGVFAAGLLRGGEVDLRLARRWLASGRQVGRPVFTSIRTEFRKGIATKLARPDTVRSLSLRSKDLTSLPEEIFAFRNLRTLDLSGNRLRALPERIGELTELRELHLRGNGLRSLPDSIGNLTELRHLDVEANCLAGLPDGLARCTRLRTVHLTNNPYSYVRASFGSWQRVELMWSLPDCLFELPELEQLSFNQTFVRSLPARPFASPNLATVHVRSTLLLDHDPELHPQLVIDTDSSRDRAENYVRYWFDEDVVRPELFLDRSGGYDFTEVTALLTLLLRIVIPTAAPYAGAVRNFQRQTADVTNALRRYPQGTEHVRRLATALTGTLDRWDRTAPGHPLITGLRPIFADHL